MIYTWENVDIQPGRRFWGHNRADDSLSMIGFDSTLAKPNNYYVTSLADGMIYAKEMTLQDVADWLNQAKSRPDVIAARDIQKAIS